MAEQKSSDSSQTETGKSKKKLFILLGGGVVLLIVILAAVWFFFLRAQPATKKEDPGEKVPVPSVNTQVTIGPMVDIKPFVVNIISQDEHHYVKAALTLELTGDKTKDEVTERLPQIRDAILLLVGNKTYDELQDLQGKEQLKAELIVKLNGILQTGKVKAVYFTDFVVQ